jgi:ectoine hydroxylase-related dioxygenase (phytanoyl-CoA dioxygenase family)
MYDMTPIEHLDLFGYCLIEDAIPAAQADQIADRCLRLHDELQGQPNLQTSRGYETLFGVMNYGDFSWPCVIHPGILAVVRALLGPEAQVEECCSKLARPGAPAGGVHTDSAEDLPAVLPEVPWMINSMWMMTDFTPDNGATLVAPFSHRARRRPPEGMVASDKHLVPVTGRRGSVFLWHGGIWHVNGANTTPNQTRVGLNIAYYPIWWNPLRDEDHQPIKKHVYENMPPQLQDMLRARQEQ